MSGWESLLLLAGAAVLLWLAIRMVRTNPQAFNKANLGKSLYTVGLLTLMILALITLCVIMLRSG